MAKKTKGVGGKSHSGDLSDKVMNYYHKIERKQVLGFFRNRKKAHNAGIYQILDRNISM